MDESRPADHPPAEAACTVALMALPGMGPARLDALLARWPAPEAWDEIRSGDPLADPGVAAACGPKAGPVVAGWRAAACHLEPAQVWERHRRAGIEISLRGSAGYPSLLDDDPEPPAVLFHQGSLEPLQRRRVAIVGTRRCTRYGRDVARELGYDLASQGVCIVSGLALGIDGAAHAGALAARAAPPVAVVATGLDVVYPKRHADLWADVAASGAVLAESPLGSRPDGWRFPARNRIIAALAEVVVVVESPHRGGSMHTVEAAEARGAEVMAVPGSVRSPASAGTNHLLSEGYPPARHAADVLTALGLKGGGERARPDPRPDPDDSGRAVLSALGWEPATLEQVASRLGQPLGPLSVVLTRLRATGWVAESDGWFERLAPPL